MRYLVILKVAFRALRRNKLRTALTMLGIVIGVGAVIAMVGIFDGEQARRDTSAGASPLGFLHNAKLYQLGIQLQQKMSASLQAYARRQQQQFQRQEQHEQQK